MRSGGWVSRLGIFVAGAVIVGALAFLQVLYAEKDLLSCLAAYAAIAVAALIAFFASRSILRTDFLCLCASVIFFGYVIIRALTSPVPYVARTDLYFVLAGLVLYTLTLTAFSSAQRRIALLVALLAFAVVHVLVSVVQTGLGANLALLSRALETVEPNARASGLFVDPDHLAGLLEVLGIFGLSITCWSRRPAWIRVFVGYLTGICYLGLVLTGSRGGYLSVGTSILVFVLLSIFVLRKAGASVALKLGGIGLLILAAAAFALWTVIQQSHILQRQTANIVTVDQARVQLWQAAVEQWKLRPLIGTGSGTYLFYGRQFRSPETQLDPVDVHNDYLHLLCEYGLIGAAGFLFFFLAHLRHGWRTFLRLGPKRVASGSLFASDRLALNMGALCAIAAYLVHSAVDFNMHIPANGLLFALAFGIIANPGMPVSGSAVTNTNRVVRIALPVLSAILLLQCSRLLPGEYFCEKARTSLRDEEPDAAVSFAHKALTHEKNNPNIYFYLGRALVSLGNTPAHAADRLQLHEQALIPFEQARRAAPLDGTYPLEIAAIYDRLGRFDEAEKMYDLARQRDPRSIAVEERYQAHLEAQKSVKGE